TTSIGHGRSRRPPGIFAAALSATYGTMPNIKAVIALATGGHQRSGFTRASYDIELPAATLRRALGPPQRFHLNPAVMSATRSISVASCATRERLPAAAEAPAVCRGRQRRSRRTTVNDDESPRVTHWEDRPRCQRPCIASEALRHRTRSRADRALRRGFG